MYTIQLVLTEVHIDLRIFHQTIAKTTMIGLVVGPRLLGRSPHHKFCVVEPEPNLAGRLQILIISSLQSNQIFYKPRRGEKEEEQIGLHAIKGES